MAEYNLPRNDYIYPDEFGDLLIPLEEIANRGTVWHYLGVHDAKKLTSSRSYWDAYGEPKLRVLHDVHQNQVILKNANKSHRFAVGDFSYMFLCQFVAHGIDIMHINDNEGVQYESEDGQLFKEPDVSWAPFNTRSLSDTPTMVLELGFLTMHQLQCDARHWLTRYGGRVRIAILVQICTAQKVIRIQNWRRAECGAPKLVQELTISVAGNGPPAVDPPGGLEIPLELFFDKIPPDVTARVVRIDDADLIKCAEGVFLWIEILACQV